MGNGSTIRPGDVQRMSAGTGVQHSEFNPSSSDKTHLLQIWIQPAQQGIAPGYEERHFERAEKQGKLRLIASPEGEGGAVTIHQDARLFVGLFNGAEHSELPLAAQRLTYVHLARGELNVNGHTLKAGDALMLQQEQALNLSQGVNAEVLVFDLPH
jgi:hypothetical protein